MGCPPCAGVTTPEAVVGPHGGAPLPPSLALSAGGGMIKLKCAWAAPEKKGIVTTIVAATSWNCARVYIAYLRKCWQLLSRLYIRRVDGSGQAAGDRSEAADRLRTGRRVRAR